MTPGRRTRLSASLAAGLLMMMLAPIAPLFARTGDYYGPLYGSSESIARAQSVLKAEHYLSSGWQPGNMDRPTIAALREFQRDHFIPANGLLDHETMAQLATHESYRRVAGGRSLKTPPAAAGAAGASTERQASLRTMPETGSPLPLLAGLGGLLLGAGLLLMRRRTA